MMNLGIYLLLINLRRRTLHLFLSRISLSNLLYFLLNLRRHSLYEKVLLLFDLRLKFLYPSPQFLLLQPPLRSELTQITNKCSKNLRINSIALPLVK